MAPQTPPDLLYLKFLQGDCTPEELAALFRYFDTVNEDALRVLIENELQASEGGMATATEQQRLAELKELIDARITREGESKRVVRLWPRIAAAASVILLIGVGAYFVFHKKQASVQLVQNQPVDIAPGQNRATLTLANGQKIILAKGLKGQLAVQGSTIIQASDNNITYNANPTQDESVNYNTLATARGEQSPYPLVLADGTKVWLDAASSVTFPTAFTGKERLVKVTGQAYFEVAHRADQPFKISIRDLVVRDIGTEFNINAYTDEPTIKTTLVNGAVRVSKADQSVLLKPGQMAVAANSISVQQANVEESIAWKNGYFRYESIELKELMKQVARWYDIEVAYGDSIRPHEFFIDTKRKTNLSNMLKILEQGGVHFKIDGRKLTITQ